MNSRKMVLLNLFAGQGMSHRSRGQTCGHSRGRSRWDEFREYHCYTHTLVVQLIRPPWTGSSAHGIFQARISEWGATSSSIESS